MTMPTNREFEMQLSIAAAPYLVWRAVSEAQEVARWFAPEVEIVPGPDGRVVWKWGITHTWKSVIEVWEPGKRLRLRYDSPVSDGKGGKRPLFVDFILHSEKGVTALRLVHSGFGPEADFDGEYDGISKGWPVELRSLRLYVENHFGRDRHLAWATRSTTLDTDQAKERLLGKDGLNADHLISIAPGDAYAVSIEGTEGIRGAALYSPSSREFSGTAENLGKGWFRVHCDYWAGATQVWLWLATYDDGAGIAQYQAAFERILDRVVPGSAIAKSPSAQ